MKVRYLRDLDVDDQIISKETPTIFDYYLATAMNVLMTLRVAEGNLAPPDGAFFDQSYDMAERMMFERHKRSRSIEHQKNYEKEWTFEKIDLPEGNSL
jgi:hypothetical protein